MKRTIVAAVILILATAISAAQAPEQSYAGATDGVAAPFVGEWAAFRPSGEANTIITCAAPIAITALGDTRVDYGTFSSTGTPFDLAAAEGRTTWTGSGESAIAIWIEPDEFHMVPVVRGEPDWPEVLVYHRCPVMPRESYAGAPNGLAAPFAGRWSLAMPSTTGNTPDELLAGCDGPVIIAADDETALTFTNPEGDASTAHISPHDGHSDWAIADGPDPWEVVWIGPDRFHAHILGIDGATDWRQPFILTRCKD